MPKKERGALSLNSGWIILSAAAMFATAPLAASSPANALAFSFTQLDVPGATGGTFAQGINDAGQIVGSFGNSTGGHGFLDTGGSFTQLDVPGGGFTQAFGINGAAQIVGAFNNSTGTHGFLATQAVPEPATLTLLSISLTLTGLAMMRRRATSTSPKPHGYRHLVVSTTLCD